MNAVHDECFCNTFARVICKLERGFWSSNKLIVSLFYSLIVLFSKTSCCTTTRNLMAIKFVFSAVISQPLLIFASRKSVCVVIVIILLLLLCYYAQKLLNGVMIQTVWLQTQHRWCKGTWFYWFIESVLRSNICTYLEELNYFICRWKHEMKRIYSSGKDHCIFFFWTPHLIRVIPQTLMSELFLT